MLWFNNVKNKQEINQPNTVALMWKKRLSMSLTVPKKFQIISFKVYYLSERSKAIFCPSYWQSSCNRNLVFIKSIDNNLSKYVIIISSSNSLAVVVY